MRKFLRIFFWSHGTLLGYLGSLSHKGLPEMFSEWVLINLSNPLRHHWLTHYSPKILIWLGHGVIRVIQSCRYISEAVLRHQDFCCGAKVA